MAKKLTKEQFIEKAQKVHGDKYNYGLVEYEGAHKKINILCKKHNKLFLQFANDHVKGSGCPKCANEKTSISLSNTKEQFIKKAKEIHGDKYDYSETNYINNRLKVEIGCKNHNIYFLISPDNHIQGQGCTKCAYEKKSIKKRKTTQQFIQEAKIIHDNKYDYSKVVYFRNNLNVEILCDQHGCFNQTPSAHLQGSGCPACGREKTGFRKTDFVKRANGKSATFYVLRCFNESEEFYKIGITKNNIKRRYCGAKYMPYNYEIISEVFGEAGFIWDLELAEKRKLKNLQYIPKIYFMGSKTECFTQYKI